MTAAATMSGRFGPLGWTMVALAVAFQVLVTPVIHGNPIRIATADMMMPVLLAVALYQWGRGIRPWPPVPVRHFWTWVALLTAWMAVSLAVGRLETGSWQKWALVNKFAGWFVLLGFLVAGLWVAQAATARLRDLFIRSLALWAAAVSLAFAVLFMVLRPIDPSIMPRLSGLAGNPNSFGYLMAVVAMVALAAVHRTTLFGPRRDLAVLGLLGLALLLSGSRSAGAGLVLGLTVLAALGCLPYRKLLAATGVALLLACVAYGIPALVIESRAWLPAETAWLPAESIGGLTTYNAVPYLLRADTLNDSGINHRLRITLDAFHMWQEHPLRGIGLGTFYWADTHRHEAPATIHNSALWLLTETGLIGLGLFTGALVVIGRGLWRNLRMADGDPLAVGGAAALAVMIGASVGMEAIYQRHVWFLAGYALVACLRKRATD